MEYLLKSSGIVIILFLFYYLFLKNETFFNSIRSYFIIGLLVVLTIPLVKIPIYVEAINSQFNLAGYEEISSTKSIASSINWEQLITFIYLIGVVFFSVKFLIQLISLSMLVSKHQIKKQENYYFIETSKNISPFSFFNFIIYNKNHFTLNELKHILNHEKAHAKQLHSIDTILAHLLVITLWFNPFVWLYKKAVQQNLEFLADANALKLTTNQKHYQLTLLKTCNISYCTEITNNFYNSLIKKRIVMLHKNKSKNKNQWKYTLLLPLLAAFILTFNTTTIAQEKKITDVEKVSNVKVELVIDKNSTNEHLKKEARFFKKEFDITLTFKGIKRNPNNEITAIKIDAKGKDLKAKFENSGTVPIKPIKITYDSDNNSISIGNLNKIHENHFTYKIKEKGDAKFKGKSDKDGNYVFVTSDGKTKTWTSKGDKENVWIHKKNKDIKVEVISSKEGEHTVKVIHEGEDIEFDGEHEIEVIEKHNDGDNIFIIKSEDNENKKPLIFIDGKKTSSEELKNIDTNQIENIEVLKGESAIKKYGEKAKDGVIVINTKKN